MSSLSDTLADNLPVANTMGTTEKTTEKILCFIKENPQITYRELAEALGLTEDCIYWSVKQLRGQGLLRRVSGRKEGCWEIIKE